jgi:tetratricopeptide (TPR) repeat protein
MVYNNIGYAYGLQGKWADAEPAYRQAVQYHREAGNIAGMVETMDGLAQSIETQGRHDEAVAMLKNALEELERMEADAGRHHLRDVVTAHLAGLTQWKSS